MGQIVVGDRVAVAVDGAESIPLFHDGYLGVATHKHHDALFASTVLMEKYREGQKELHCVFVDPEKAYDKVPIEEVWYCMRKSELAKKYVRIVQYVW